ncbi:tripartite tricarboxylate transporter TctB family protein [Micrococcus endophyticus]|uniref:tripartite tricarboxylate transporter TctB family protein n=1 Tax=Micrococcus endophyticus TaxID=455343 RepID=UPI0034CD6943
MTTHQTLEAAEPAEATAGGSPGFGHGRSGLLIPLILAAFSTYLLVGLLTMEIPSGAKAPGPQFFPSLVMVAGYVVAAALAVRLLRTPEPPVAVVYGEHEEVSEQERREAEEAAAVHYPTFTDWRCVAWALGGFLGFAAILTTAGWIISAAFLFWCVARAMDSRTPLRDVVVALTVSSLVHLGFGVALGLNLPAGFLGGGF